MDLFFHDKNFLSPGITTGTCATAASLALMHYLLTGEILDSVKVSLPQGGFIFVGVKKENDGSFSVVKDAGDDPDVTDKAKVKARILPAIFIDNPKSKEVSLKGINDKVVMLNSSNSTIVSEDKELCGKRYFSSKEYPGIYLTGGYGVGTVTKEGLEQEKGFPAINKVPREMIFSAVGKEFFSNRGQAPCLNCELLITSYQNYLIIISVLNGADLAKKTFNPRLGIEGGISILGTTGIVEPMSERALVKSIEAEMRIALAEGDGNLYAAPGNYGEKYIKENNITDSHVILCSNFIGETIDLAVHLNASSLTIVGNCGKLCKLAAGIMNTHSRIADGRFEVFAANAALANAPFDAINELKSCITTDEMLSILTNYGLREKVVNNIMSAIREHVTYRAKDLNVHVIMYSEKYGLLGKF